MARDLRLFYLFRLVSTSYLFVPVTVAFALSRGLSLMQVWLLSTVYSAVVILTEVPTGSLADRFGRRVTMMVGALAMVASCTTYVFAHSFITFAAAVGLAALSMTLCSGADSAYLFDLLNDHGRGDEYPRREGTASAWHQAGQALAFLAGGLLGQHSLVLPYMVTGGVATLAFVVALVMRENGVRPALGVSPRAFGVHVRESLRFAIGRGALRWAIGYSAVVFVILRATEYAYQPYLGASGFSIAETGMVYAAMYLVAAAVAHNFAALRRGFAESTLVWTLVATLTVTFLILGNIAGPLALVVMLVQNGANGLYSPLVKLLLQREIPDSRQRATVLSVESMVRRAAFGLFSPVLGWLTERYGPGSGLTLCGLFGLVGMGLLAITYRRELVAAPVRATRVASGRAPSETVG